MKKIIKIVGLSLIILLIPLIIVLSSSALVRSIQNKPFYYNQKSNNNSNAIYTTEVSRIKYAKVKENCYLFKTSDITDATHRNIKYIIPESYFVTILSDINTMIKKVQYRNMIGYVASDSIKIVDFLPVSPTLENVTFDIPEDVGTQIRSTPEAEDSSNVIKIIPAGTKSVTYIASTIGVIPTGGSSNIWYYAIYTPISDPTSVYEGYVYSAKTENLTSFELNTEDVDEIINDKDDNSIVNFTINETVKIVLIILICIPIVLVFVLLVVSNRRKKKEEALIGEYRQEHCEENQNVYKDSSVEKNRVKKVKDFSGKTFERKSLPTKFFTEQLESETSSDPIFPTYEIIDDDDLL